MLKQKFYLIVISFTNIIIFLFNKNIIIKRFVYRSLQLIEKIAMNQNLLQSIIYLDNPIVFTIINIQSRVLLLLETSEESDYKLSSMIDLIKISTLFFKLINAILEYSYDENRELYDIIVKYVIKNIILNYMKIIQL